MLDSVKLGQYMEARRAGWSPAVALYTVRPPVVDLVEFPYGSDRPEAEGVSQYAESGTFTLDGVEYVWQVEDANGECFCYEEALPAWREYKDNPDASPVAIMSPDEVEATTHRTVGVSVAGEDEWAWMGSVCGTRTTPLDRRLDDRFLADTFADMASEAADMAETTRRRQEDAREAAEDERMRRNAAAVMGA